ncbi:phosphate/phosphite/phosphonate ABC transporter substrate-binding protein [Photobacterium sp. DNB23_23_1]|uniref:Phosphate/phosphite/phosphonate ABC transporter substrate-binding protein n=1 Tax=Photobacterium pectinilyticum TaxID=2906793 RepID=A0ABT1N720_9GAMM|nr:phosphate/phosphite/phosphonate ABC transporter substrate-binding protein [Photobacterium sp. ZSDE20]MCQ1060546.1 phosphate/phosphite/phosphonate ABC transporter substrate-binding protein [Photobacterium sp. ZSDE20]MDD1828011.1 phosphate/phosphite/phosphonate ABC transporter substrate-binding protein [Photobacterium sp. ZSDE20]
MFKKSLAAAVSLVLTTSVFAMDARYEDRAGNLTADLPQNEAEWVNPSTLVFAYTPVEDPSVYASVWSEFLEHMEEKTGKSVRFFPVQNNAAQIEAMRSGRLHIAGFNTGSTPLAVNCSGFVPFTIMAGEDGSFGYEMEIITHADSGIESVDELKGKNLAFTSQTSNSGFKAPSAILKAEYDMIPERDFNPAFSGAHDNSIIGVAHKDYDAAAVANSVLQRMLDREVVKASDIKNIYTSQTFPTTAYGLAHNLHPELQEKIKEAFFSFDWEGTKLQEEFTRNGEAKFIPITYQEHWAVIRTIDEANDVSYSCR